MSNKNETIEIDKWFDSFKVRNVLTGETCTVDYKFSKFKIFNKNVVKTDYIVVDGTAYEINKFEEIFNDEDDYGMLELLEEVRRKK